MVMQPALLQMWVLQASGQPYNPCHGRSRSRQQGCMLGGSAATSMESFRQNASSSSIILGGSQAGVRPNRSSRDHHPRGRLATQQV